MKKCYCDKCGRDIKDVFKVELTWNGIFIHSIKKSELCTNCFKKLKEYLVKFKLLEK